MKRLRMALILLALISPSACTALYLHETNGNVSDDCAADDQNCESEQ